MQLARNKTNIRLASILGETVSQYISFIARSNKIGGAYKSTNGTQHYGFIPTSTVPILETLFRLHCHMGGRYEYGCYKFLDIGCGIGNIVLLAGQIGFNAHGLEYNRKICGIAKDLVGKSRIFRGNMITFKNYGKYDVLYYYVPMADSREMGKFAIRLMEAMRVGAYVIPNGYGSPFHSSKEFEQVKLGKPHHAHHVIYRKMKDRKT